MDQYHHKVVNVGDDDRSLRFDRMEGLGGGEGVSYFKRSFKEGWSCQ